MSSPAESARLEALRRLDVLDSETEQAFDDLTALAASICGTPISVISLVDADRLWFKSRVGLELEETPRSRSFCGHAILEDRILVVADAAGDRRFAASPLVAGGAGGPLLRRQAARHLRGPRGRHPLRHGPRAARPRPRPSSTRSTRSAARRSRSSSTGARRRSCGRRSPSSSSCGRARRPPTRPPACTRRWPSASSASASGSAGRSAVPTRWSATGRRCGACPPASGGCPSRRPTRTSARRRASSSRPARARSRGCSRAG